MLAHLRDVDYEYLTRDQLAGFEKYKYCAVDTNPLSVYVMHPFWNVVVEVCPRWVAPNALTLAGFLLTVLACVLLSIYDFHFNGATEPSHPVPPWVFLACAFLIFLAYTLDGIDGKQARRTGTSGPLGELFDHGLDSWTSALIPTCLYSIFGQGGHSVSPLRYYWVCWNVFITFYVTHWEKYNTGVLFLPWGYDFSMLSTTALFLVTWAFGQGVWRVTLGSLSMGRLLEIVFYLTSIIATLPISIYNIVRSYQERTGHMRTFGEAMRPLVPLVWLLAACSAWVMASPGLLAAHPRAFYLTTGTVFSNITCRLVVSQMSSTRCEAWNGLLWPMFAGALLGYLLPGSLLELLYLYLLWLLVTILHIHYGSCLVRQMCRHFNILSFRIKDNNKHN